MWKINDEQRDGLAKVADNLATAAMVGIFAGGVVESKTGWKALLLLFFIFVVLICTALNLRKKEAESGD